MLEVIISYALFLLLITAQRMDTCALSINPTFWEVKEFMCKVEELISQVLEHLDMIKVNNIWSKGRIGAPRFDQGREYLVQEFQNCIMKNEIFK